MAIWNVWPVGRLWKAYLAETNPKKAEQLRDTLYLERLHPILVRIVGRKFKIAPRPGPDPFPSGDYVREQATDVLQAAQVSVLTAMEKQWATLHCPPDEEPSQPIPPILDIEKYAATLTFQAFRAHLEEKNPEWRAMKEAILYLLKHSPNVLALHKVDKMSYCCLPTQVPWLDQNPHFAPGARWHELERDPDPIAAKVLQDTEGSLHESTGRRAALVRLLAWTGHPVLVDDMADLLLHLVQGRGIEILRWTDEDETTDPLVLVPDPGLTPEQHLLIRRILERHWGAFRDLTQERKRVLALTWETGEKEKENREAFVHLLAEWQVTRMESVTQECVWEETFFIPLWPQLIMADKHASFVLNKTSESVRFLRHKALNDVKNAVQPWT